VSIEIQTPFQLTPSGAIAVTTDPGVQAQQHVTSLVSTSPGERVMLPAYGVPLAALVFASNDPVVVATIEQDVTTALAEWEPSIIVNSVSPAAGQDPSQGAAMVNVDFQAGATPGAPGASVQTATILVGGTVVSDDI
jgi:hypothetical protein